MARPIEYKPEYVDVVYQYLDTTGREQTKLPKRVDIALLLDVDDETLIEWGKKFPLFSAALTRVDRMQMSVLMDDGFYGGKEVNPRMAQFLLSANHGMREKSDVTTDGKPMPILAGMANVQTNPSNKEDPIS